MKDPIKDTMRKTLSYWYVDGLTELATGILLAIVSLLMVALAMLVPDAIANQLSGFGLPILILIGGVVLRRAVSSLKEHLTYPRTGYVACSTSRVERKIWTIAAGIAASVAIVFISVQFKLDWLAYVAPALMAAVLIGSIGLTYGLHRFYGLAVYTLLLGIPLVALHLADRANLALFLFGCAAGFIVSGALTLRGYLQTTQPPIGETE